jgi:hypothetical protein
MSRLPYFLDKRLTDGGEVKLTLRPLFTLRKIPWYSFLLKAESIRDPYCGWKV